MSPKLNWATVHGKLKSAVPMTAMTHAANIESQAANGVKTVVISERLIEVRFNGRTIQVWGTKP